jgi:glycosyltransferase involved in cell wall biosynthesis
MNKIRVTFGIPAHNEEKNLPCLLDSIILQKQVSWKLENIVIVLDGCTDKTYEVAKKYKEKYKFINIINDKKRYGKATRLSQIYAKNKSEILFPLDADLVLVSENGIENAIKAFKDNPQVKLLSFRQVPVIPDSIYGKAGAASFRIYEYAFLKHNNGNNIYSFQGGSYGIRKEMADKITLPANVISDQKYLYGRGLKMYGRGFYKITTKTAVYFRPTSTLRDWRVLGARSIFTDIDNVRELLGDWIMDEFNLPKQYYFEGVFKFFWQYPIATVAATLLSILVHYFPMNTQKNKKGNYWDMLSSTKEAIGTNKTVRL